MQGFSLIELLIVMLIISIVSTVTLLTIHHNENTEITTVSKQLANAITLAEEEAMLRPATIGIALSKQGYQFYQYQKNAWVPLNTRPLTQYSIPSDLQIHLIIQEKLVELTKIPQIVIFASGDLTPFRLLFGKKNHSPYYEIIGKENGDIETKKI